MEEQEIIELIYARDERGLSELENRFSRLIMKIALGVLTSREDAEELVNDVLLCVWNGLSGERPDDLTAYVCKIARRQTLNCLRYNTAAKRNFDLLTELDECVPSRGGSPEALAESGEISAAIDEWLDSLDEDRYRLFMLRYFYLQGAAMMIGGAVFAAFMHDFHTVRFDEYAVNFNYQPFYDMTDEDEARFREEKRIKYPGFANGRSGLFAIEIAECYAEVDLSCSDYAVLIAKKYRNNADLDFTVENDGKLLTIRFTGTGYPENGEPEPLSRTYIFDIEGVGVDKMPKLLNRAEIIGY